MEKNASHYLQVIFTAQSLASTEEDKSLPTNNSGRITEDILQSFSATNSLVFNSDLTRTIFFSNSLISVFLIALFTLP